MSYWLEDASGGYLGDLASNMGLADLREGESGALREFLEEGEADDKLVEGVVSQTKNSSKLSYIADMLDGAVTPVFVTDGCGEVDEEKYHPSQPRVSGGSIHGGEWSGSTIGAGGIIGGKVKPYSQMTSSEIQGQLKGLSDWNDRKKRGERKIRKGQTDRYKEAKKKRDNLEKMGTQEEIRKANDEWGRLVRDKAPKDQRMAAYVAIRALKKPKDAKAYGELQKEVERAGEKIIAFEDQCRKWSPEKRAVSMLTLDKGDQCKMTVDDHSNNSSSVSGGIKLFQSLVHKDTIGGRVFFESTQESRSSYDGHGVVKLSNGSRKKTVVHELGHLIEDANKPVGSAARQFLRSRTQGSPLKSLGRSYEKDEKYKRRSSGKKWIAPYMGKIYRSGSTEITSMGLELYATKPLSFLKRDPEMFGLIASIARGKHKR